MATQFIFNNKVVKIPGVRSVIRSGIRNPALDLAFGNVLIIDTGILGSQYGGGRGIDSSSSTNNDDPFYTFDNSRDFQRHVHGGSAYVLGEVLFNPGGGAVNGSSSVSYVRASTTSPATIGMNFNSGANGGAITVACKNEGYVGNGVEFDETRATSTISVTTSGSTSDTISVTYDGVQVGFYILASGQTVNDTAEGLSKAINETGILSATVSANMVTVSATRGKGASANASTLSITTEGVVVASATPFAGGVDGTSLSRGYASKLVAGTNDTSAFSLEFYRGSYLGTDEKISLDGGRNIGGIVESGASPELIAKSPEFTSLQTVIDWINTNQSFNEYFSLTSSSITGTGEVVAGDLLALSGNNLASGGIELYSVASLDNVLDSIDGQTYDFILLDGSGSESRSANNLRIFSWVESEAKNPPSVIIAGGDTSTEFASNTIAVAKAYNSQNVSVVHSGVLKATPSEATGFRRYKSLYHAAAVLGRESGMEPQIPLTFKGVGVDGLIHKMKTSEIEQGLDSGVIMTQRSGSFFDIVKGVNTLQKNNFIVNEDGTTSSKQLRRIVRQINKEIIFNAKEQLLKKPNGTNRNTLSEEDVAAWIDGFLSSKVANNADSEDNLIISYQDITVVRNQDAYEITYAIIPNSEVSFLFFTGFLIDPNN